MVAKAIVLYGLYVTLTSYGIYWAIARICRKLWG